MANDTLRPFGNLAARAALKKIDPRYRTQNRQRRRASV